MILHTVNKSPESAPLLRDCLALARPDSAVLLLEDGVYGAVDTPSNRDLLEQAPQGVAFYVLAPDLEARGLSGRTLPPFKPVDYEGFVALCATCAKVQNWY